MAILHRNKIIIMLFFFRLLQDYPSQSFYAVFDGHVGVEAASYASIHLLTNIVRHQSFLDDPVTAIKEGVKLTDEQFCKKVGKLRILYV